MIKHNMNNKNKMKIKKKQEEKTMKIKKINMKEQSKDSMTSQAASAQIRK